MKILLTILLFTSILFASVPKTSVTFDLSKAYEKELNLSRLNGTCLPVWNSPALYNDIKKGLIIGQYKVLRFPNGSLSNEYHWNSEGTFTKDGLWIPDSVSYKPGFKSKIKHSGTSRYHYGSETYSYITDGDTNTMWWSDTQIETVTPWFYLEFQRAVDMDSIVIHWGTYKSQHFSIDIWDGSKAEYPGPHAAKTQKWTEVFEESSNSSSVSVCTLPEGTKSFYLRLVLHKSADAKQGTQVKELYVFNDGKQISSNKKKYTGLNSISQTKVIALQTHASIKSNKGQVYSWDFETFMTYANSFPYETTPVICINYSTGTPQEAAAWVHYANKVKRYTIKYWQIGNEMDGAWEEGGPVSAKTYAEKYLKIAQAMLAVDPTIKIFGPVASNADNTEGTSSDNDSLSFVEGVLKAIGAEEKKSGKTFCHGFDYHSYPYWWEGKHSVSKMLLKSDLLYNSGDDYQGLINKYLLHPESTLVFLSEYNSSVVSSHLVNRNENGIVIANIFASMVEKFGFRAMNLVWDSFEGGSVGPDGTYGSLTLFNKGLNGVVTSHVKPPSATFWGGYIAGVQWVRNDDTNRPVPGEYSRETSKIRAYGLLGDKGFRVLLLNIGVDSQLVDLSITGNVSDIIYEYTWGPQHFNWLGTDEKANAFPNCGPTGNKISNTDSILIAPNTIKVIDFEKPAVAEGSPVVIHAGAKNQYVNFGDSLYCWISVADNNKNITSIEYTIDDKSAYKPCASLDKSFDSPSEVCVLRIPGSELENGKHTLYFRATTSDDKTVVYPLPIVKKGEIRPVLVIDNFEDEDLTSRLLNKGSLSRWNNYAHEKASSNTNITVTVAQREDSVKGHCLSGVFNIVQPKDLGFPNFVNISLTVDTAEIKKHPNPLLGIEFDYNTSHSGNGNFMLIGETYDDAKYDNYNYKLADTKGNWKHIRIFWNDFAQEGWGAKIPQIAPENIKVFEFRANTEGKGHFLLDNFSFLSDQGKIIGSIYPGNNSLSLNKFLRIVQRQNIVFFHFPDHNKNTIISIYNLFGKLIYNKKYNVNARKIISLDLLKTLHSQGHYIISSKTDEATIVQQILFIK